MNCKEADCYVVVIVAINKYTHDTQKEIEFLREKLQEQGVELSLVESWEKGGQGAEELAKEVANIVENEKSNFQFLYPLEMTLKEKIETDILHRTP